MVYSLRNMKLPHWHHVSCNRNRSAHPCSISKFPHLQSANHPSNRNAACLEVPKKNDWGSDSKRERTKGEEFERSLKSVGVRPHPANQELRLAAVWQFFVGLDDCSYMLHCLWASEMVSVGTTVLDNCLWYLRRLLSSTLMPIGFHSWFLNTSRPEKGGAGKTRGWYYSASIDPISILAGYYMCQKQQVVLLAETCWLKSEQLLQKSKSPTVPSCINNIVWSRRWFSCRKYLHEQAYS